MTYLEKNAFESNSRQNTISLNVYDFEYLPGEYTILETSWKIQVANPFLNRSTGFKCERGEKVFIRKIETHEYVGGDKIFTGMIDSGVWIKVYDESTNKEYAKFEVNHLLSGFNFVNCLYHRLCNHPTI
jgi:hypothetical protein